MPQFKSMKDAMNFANTRVKEYKRLISDARKNNDMTRVKKLYIALKSIKVKKVPNKTEPLYEVKGM